MRHFEFKISVDLGDSFDNIIPNEDVDFRAEELLAEIKDHIDYYLHDEIIKHDKHDDEIKIGVKESKTIKGWVARDKDGSLWFHYNEPHLENEIEKTWWGSSDSSFEIFDFIFPEYKDVTFEGGPVKVELSLDRL